MTLSPPFSWSGYHCIKCQDDTNINRYQLIKSESEIVPGFYVLLHTYQSQSAQPSDNLIKSIP